MDEPYEPESDFLKAVAAGDIPLAGSSYADANLRQLITMTQDAELSNRDWATMLLAGQPCDSIEVRDALLASAKDTNDVVRCEAMLGLAMRDTKLALPLVHQELLGDLASMALFEAAALIASPTLIEALRPWTIPSQDPFLDQLASDALRACNNGTE